MITLRDVNVPLDLHNNLKECCAAQLKTDPSNIVSIKVLRRSIDARKRNDVHFVYSFEVEVKNSEQRLCRNCKKAEISKSAATDQFLPVRDTNRLSPVIIGSGPAGLFCALEFIKYGYAPIIVERGQPIDVRVNDVDKFNITGALNTNSNIQFGEGGAGTFSDGKLNTGVSSSHRKNVLETFVRFGAPDSILYEAQPHIGTDILRQVVKNFRRHITENGGKYLFSSKLVGLELKDGKISAAIIESQGDNTTIDCDVIVLAVGHSARDTFEMLYNAGVPMQQKAFAVGARIEHLQQTINKGRYGDFCGHPALSAANYNLSYRRDGIGVFTFCMCPGGTVVAAASEEGGVVTNGMSYHARDGENANSAVLVGVSTEDFGSDDIFAGVRYQQRIEKAAYKYTNSYKAPCQRLVDFMQSKATVNFGNVVPTYTAGVFAGDVSVCLPQKIINSMREGLTAFGRQLPGFDDGDALITAPETRSSSPIRILRGIDFESAIKGLYPCGEGAGYAGGITSAAIDGIRVAQSIMNKK